ncbi:VOC family protein [Falsiroseomonas sp.]|uniref:VOC family protein n=1 Tax=Falsiroseomonas sp. TaxID=2870721 RepID=UPI003566376F
MPVSGLDHVNIRCRPEDLPAMRRFWGEVVGLAEGPRPDFDFPGIWFWAGARAVVHIAARLPDGAPLPAGDAGTFGHIALRADGLEETRGRLARLGIASREAPVPGFPLHQIFLTDPAGVAVELTFAA